jgi:RIO-like serine/threonine protein kinase
VADSVSNPPLSPVQDAVECGWLRRGACARDAPPDLPKILGLAEGIASGLAHLHGCGVVHADLSAANVLLCRCASA